MTLTRFRTGTHDCLWCTINPVEQAGEVCSYECYSFWIAFHLREEEDAVLKIDEHETMILPLELQGFHQRVWTEWDA